MHPIYPIKRDISKICLNTKSGHANNSNETESTNNNLIENSKQPLPPRTIHLFIGLFNGGQLRFITSVRHYRYFTDTHNTTVAYRRNAYALSLPLHCERSSDKK